MGQYIVEHGVMFLDTKLFNIKHKITGNMMPIQNKKMNEYLSCNVLTFA